MDIDLISAFYLVFENLTDSGLHSALSFNMETRL